MAKINFHEIPHPRPRAAIFHAIDISFVTNIDENSAHKEGVIRGQESKKRIVSNPERQAKQIDIKKMLGVTGHIRSTKNETQNVEVIEID